MVSPLILVIHRRGEYPFGFNDVLIGFDLTFVMSVSRSSDFRIINIAAFRFLIIRVVQVIGNLMISSSQVTVASSAGISDRPMILFDVLKINHESLR